METRGWAAPTIQPRGGLREARLYWRSEARLAKEAA
jgi:hypothetical protein